MCPSIVLNLILIPSHSFPFPKVWTCSWSQSPRGNGWGFDQAKILIPQPTIAIWKDQASKSLVPVSQLGVDLKAKYPPCKYIILFCSKLSLIPLATFLAPRTCSTMGIVGKQLNGA